MRIIFRGGLLLNALVVCSEGQMQPTLGWLGAVIIAWTRSTWKTYNNYVQQDLKSGHQKNI